MPQALNVALPEKCGGLFAPHRYKVLWGGRGGAKSWSIARALLVAAMASPLRILCTREYQVSVADSVHRTLVDNIKLMGLGGVYRWTKTGIFCPGSGSEFLFRGIGNDPDQIKSLEGIDRCWVEEAQSISERSWQILDPTIRKEGSEIWVGLNPHRPTDPTYRRFLEDPLPDSWVQRIGWEDNPWFPEVLRRQKDRDYARDPELAAHIWGGECETKSHAQVLHEKYVVHAFEPNPDEWYGPYFGLDFGFTDPTAACKLWVHDEKLWCEYEAYASGVDNDELPALLDLLPGSRDHTIRADNSRPETISHLRNHGFPSIVAAPKWPGSVEDGVRHLRGYEQIVIHPRCRHGEEEARLWRWKVDRLTGDVLPILVDAYNHLWDAARYALAPRIRNQDMGEIEMSEMDEKRGIGDV